MEVGDGPAAQWQEEKTKHYLRSESEGVFSVSFLQVEYTIVGQPTQGTQKPGKKNCVRVHWSLEEVPRGPWPGQSGE